MLLGDVRPALQVSAAGRPLLVLAVTRANAATLLVGRSAPRRREFPVRVGLGSGLVRLLRAALVEGLAEAAVGLVLGFVAAWADVRLRPRLPACRASARWNSMRRSSSATSS